MSIIKRTKTFKIGKKVTLQLLSGATPKDAVVTGRKGSVTKIKWEYEDNNGNLVTADGWFMNKFIIKRKKKSPLMDSKK